MLRAAALLGVLLSLQHDWIQDPVQEARGAFDRPTEGPADAEDRATRAIQAAPRRAALHCWRARAAAELGGDPADHDLRALRAQPFHPSVAAESCQRLLRAAAQRSDPRLRQRALGSLGAAVDGDACELPRALVLLRVAGATAEDWCTLAGSDRSRAQRILEYCAKNREVESTLAVGRRIDALRADREHHGWVRAHVRLAKACFQAGDAVEAVHHFASARERATDPRSFALDEADALLAAGDEAAGVEKLLEAARRLSLEASRIAGTCFQAKHPGRALEELRARAESAAEREALALLGGWCGAPR